MKYKDDLEAGQAEEDSDAVRPGQIGDQDRQPGQTEQADRGKDSSNPCLLGASERIVWVMNFQVS